ncbi:MAG: glycosyltransferase family 2 protein, partial [Candidatus Omnitrophica bacterium]|nr:glycosyltransferase family 2 protein [Candidatus Omnitrophota bacterium]
DDYEMIVINDGSPDSTGYVAEELSRRYHKLKVVQHVRNLGYAEALKTGFQTAARFDYILFTDGDNQYDIEYFKAMAPYIVDHDAVITYRTRNANGFQRWVISRVFNRLLNIMFFQPYRDLSSALRCVKRTAVQDISFSSQGIFLPVELVIKLHRKGCRIKEIPIVTQKRLHGRSSSLLPKNFFGVFKDMARVWRGR